MNITMIGIDIAKEVFQLCGVNAQGKVLLKKRLSRDALRAYIATLSACCIVMEACGSANYWARIFKQLGHEVKLISPQFVKPFVKGNKNDDEDALAIVEAASRPEMRFVTPKTVEQQDWQSLLRIREGYIGMRTKVVNQIRGLLAEYGIVMPRGISSARKRLPTLCDRHQENELSEIMKQLLEMHYEHLCDLDKRIKGCDEQLQKLANHSKDCQRLMTVPGIGVMSAVAIIATVGKGEGFKNGRHFAAFLGLVPRQHSSGHRQRLLGISKRGEVYLRQLLVHGARSVVVRSASKTDPRSQWINQLKQHRGMNKTCVALANKNARIVMSMLLNESVYRAAV